MNDDNHNEDGASVGAIWKQRAEHLAAYVADWLDYQDGMLVQVPAQVPETRL